MWEARAGDAIVVDGRTRYSDSVLGDSAQLLVATFASKKEKNDEMAAAATRLDQRVVEAAGEDALAVLGVRRRGGDLGGGDGDAPNPGGLPPAALRRVWQPDAKL